MSKHDEVVTDATTSTVVQQRDNLLKQVTALKGQVQKQQLEIQVLHAVATARASLIEQHEQDQIKVVLKLQEIERLLSQDNPAGVVSALEIVQNLYKSLTEI